MKTHGPLMVMNTKRLKALNWEQLSALLEARHLRALEALRLQDKENFGEELADVVIRTLNCAYGLEIDLAEIILEKMKKNAAREPRHGGKLF